MGQLGCGRGGRASEMVWASCSQGSQVRCLNKATDCHEGSGSGSPLEPRCGRGWFCWGSPGETSLSASRGIHNLQPLPHVTPTSRPLSDSPASFSKEPVVSCPGPGESRAASHRSILHRITPASFFGPGELTRRVLRGCDVDSSETTSQPVTEKMVSRKKQTQSSLESVPRGQLPQRRGKRRRWEQSQTPKDPRIVDRGQGSHGGSKKGDQHSSLQGEGRRGREAGGCLTQTRSWAVLAGRPQSFPPGAAARDWGSRARPPAASLSSDPIQSFHRWSLCSGFTNPGAGGEEDALQVCSSQEQQPSTPGTLAPGAPGLGRTHSDRWMFVRMQLRPQLSAPAQPGALQEPVPGSRVTLCVLFPSGPQFWPLCNGLFEPGKL